MTLFSIKMTNGDFYQRLTIVDSPASFPTAKALLLHMLLLQRRELQEEAQQEHAVTAAARHIASDCEPSSQVSS
jgi:hypothetical protein